jgi:DNA polymerase (family 10)
MNNREVANVLADIARIMELEGDDTYRIRAYRNAARSVGSLKGDINEYHRKGRLQEIPGVGKSIGELIAELLETGRSPFYETLKKEIPPELFEVLEVPGIGRRTAVKVHRALGVSSIHEFRQAAIMHRIRKLKGMGEKSERKILESIERFQKKEKETRIPLYRAMGVASEALEYLKDCGLEHALVAGSVRRYVPMVSDINIIGVSGSQQKAVDCFIRSPLIAAVKESSTDRAAVVTRYHAVSTLELVDPENWGLHMVFATGSEKHLEDLVDFAAQRGISLSHEGYVDAVTLKRTEFKAEKELYSALGLEFVPPEMREGHGEVKAAAEHALPGLVQRNDIRGDFHVHSDWSDGSGSIQDMAMAARALGYEYIAICDHSRSLAIAHGLSLERLRAQMEEIDRINDTLEGFTVLKGSEVDIKPDGTLDLPDEVLEELDIVVASVHTSLRQEPDVMTGRVVRALENPYVTILGHPTARILGGREPISIDIDEIIWIAKANGKVLELNAYPSRLDLSDDNVRKAIDANVMISIDTDAHSPFELDFMEFGIHIAQRGWAPRDKVLNTLNYDDLLRFLKT